MAAGWELALLVVAFAFAGVLLVLTTVCERVLQEPAPVPVPVIPDAPAVVRAVVPASQHAA